ncbi:unnamed protein product [Cylicostephanus goldi]|uniref:Uncharacterized protein n=1 Tax=Cylicostephanus goldi TaxID=71465 RepID=A0A3P7MNC1_CYLGO|nr:unnamed protein product [Cylicostephanus goldi]
MFAKLNDDMKRVATIYGDGSFFARNFDTYDAEVEELGKLNEAEARAQLQRYALRCHVNEKEKEQLHRRNRELNDALEILRVHILRTQTNVLDQARRVAKQATDGLNELLQSSSKEITKLNQKNALSLAQSSSLQNQLKQTTAQLEAKKEKNALSLAQSSTLQNQLKQTTAQLEAKKEALKEANKNLDMLRFERDSLQNHSDQRDQKLEQLESRIHDLSEDLKLKEEAVIKAKAEVMWSVPSVVMWLT